MPRNGITIRQRKKAKGGGWKVRCPLCMLSHEQERFDDHDAAVKWMLKHRMSAEHKEAAARRTQLLARATELFGEPVARDARDRGED